MGARETGVGGAGSGEERTPPEQGLGLRAPERALGRRAAAPGLPLQRAAVTSGAAAFAVAL